MKSKFYKFYGALGGPTVLPVAAVWAHGGKVGGSIPTLTHSEFGYKQ